LPKQLTQIKSEKLSDKMKNMAVKYPETVVLEDKFKKLEKVEPRIDASLEKVE
jgi:hypothetical protein